MPSFRIEYLKVGRSAGVNAAAEVPIEGPIVGAATLAITSSATAGGSQPVVPGGAMVVRVIAVGGAGYLALGAAPDPETEPRRYFADGDVRDFVVVAGEKFSAIEAAIS